MPHLEKTQIAILGAGPIGLEAALYASLNGWDVDVYERDRPGAHLRHWGHVAFFSPWQLNRSSWGAQYLNEQGHRISEVEAFPTGREYVERYLEPMVASDALADRVHTGHEVLGVARSRSLKGERVGDEARADHPLLVHVRSEAGERYIAADVVLDTTGVYRTPNGLGPGGLRALGEQEHAGRIDYYIPDLQGPDRPTYAGAETLVVGAGYSAVTSLSGLHELSQSAPGTRVYWLLRDTDAPYPVIEDDPLPRRRELSLFGNRAAAGEVDGIVPLSGTVEYIESRAADRMRVTLTGDATASAVAVDRIVANVGYRPDVDLFRELQVHQCYATEGPIELAASLMSADTGADCLDQSAGGASLLETPEPNFFLLGSKSYGRNSNFLLKVGYQQIEQVFDLLPHS